MNRTIVRFGPLLLAVFVLFGLAPSVANAAPVSPSSATTVDSFAATVPNLTTVEKSATNEACTPGTVDQLAGTSTLYGSFKFADEGYYYFSNYAGGPITFSVSATRVWYLIKGGYYKITAVQGVSINFQYLRRGFVGDDTVVPKDRVNEVLCSQAGKFDFTSTSYQLDWGVIMTGGVIDRPFECHPPHRWINGRCMIWIRMRF